MKKSIIAFSFLAVIICSGLTALAVPPSGGVECPDKCKGDDLVCCSTPGGSGYFGHL